MDPSIARQGIKESEKVYQLFQQLLTAVGQGSLMYNKDIDKDPTSVHLKFEQTNLNVAEILEKLKTALAETKQCYKHCQEEMAKNQSNMPSLETFLKANENTNDVKHSDEYQTIKKQLQDKNEDLRLIIDEVRHIFSDINQLSTSVPY